MLQLRSGRMLFCTMAVKGLMTVWIRDDVIFRLLAKWTTVYKVYGNIVIVVFLMLASTVPLTFDPFKQLIQEVK